MLDASIGLTVEAPVPKSIQKRFKVGKKVSLAKMLLKSGDALKPLIQKLKLDVLAAKKSFLEASSLDAGASGMARDAETAGRARAWHVLNSMTGAPLSFCL